MKRLLVMGMVGLALSAGMVLADESKCTTNATTSAIIFSPGIGSTRVKYISGYTDDQAQFCTIKARTGQKVRPAVAPTTSTNMYFYAGENLNITNSDTCVYVHSDGSCEYLTVIAAAGVTGTNIYFSSAFAAAGSTTNEWLYEVTDKMYIEPTVAYGIAGTNRPTVNVSGDPVYVSPGDSPVRISITGGAVSRIAATVDK